MVHSEVYLNKYVVSIAPFSTPVFTPPPFRKMLFFACFHCLIFHPFSRGSADPICGHPCNVVCFWYKLSRSWWYAVDMCDAKHLCDWVLRAPCTVDVKIVSMYITGILRHFSVTYFSFFHLHGDVHWFDLILHLFAWKTRLIFQSWLRVK